MRYWLCALAGIALLAAAISLVASGLYFLLLVGSCASGGPYEIAQPCPAGTGLRIGMLVGGVFGGLLALAVWSARGLAGEGASMGRAAWVLGFGALSATFLVAGFGPDAVDESTGWKVFSALMGGFFALFVLGPLLLGRAGRGRRERARRLLRTGRRAPAVVTAVDDTGVTVNDDPRVRLTFEIRPPGGAPFVAEKTTVVSRVEIPRVGDKATAWYDPADPSSFMVSFDSASRIDAGLASMGVPAAAPAPVAAAAAGTSADPLADRLRALGELRTQGVLTDEEFDRAKARLLGGTSPAGGPLP